MQNQVVSFNANRRSLVTIIPADVSPIVNMKETNGKTMKDAAGKEYKTFEGGAISFISFNAFATEKGLSKPAKGEDRTAWNALRASYNDAKLAGSRWVREQAIRACADEKLLGKKMSVKLYRAKDGFTRREVSFTLADRLKSESKVSAARLTTLEQVEAAAAKLGMKLVDASQGELPLA